jgi:predicted extracellular nuclease
MFRSRFLAFVVFVSMVVSLVPLAGTAAAISPNLVISQVYGGGGNSGATYTHDYIEIFNRGNSPVPLSGLSLQYASATGTGNFGSSTTQLTELPDVTLAAGRYFLVQEAQGAGGTTAVPADFVDATPIAMAAGAGKVALATGTSSLGCNGSTAQPCDAAALARIIDLVGYGNANFFEGSAAAPTLSNTTAAFRAGDGCTDTDNNGADFAAASASPRNALTPLHFCDVENAPSVASTSPTNGASGVARDANVSITFSEPVNVSGAWYSLSCATSGNHTATVSGGPTTFTLNPDADYGFSESCTVTVFAGQVSDQDTQDPPDNMASDHSFSFTTENPPLEIHDVQGAAHISPYSGQTVSGVEGVVTWERSSSFYMQDPTPDSSDATSEGILVFGSGVGALVNIGDRVRVGGRVVEFRPGGSGGLANLTTTEITTPGLTVVVLTTGNTLPAATVIGSGGRLPPSIVIEDDASGDVETSGIFDPASDGIDFYESLEGMLVQIDNAVAVGPTNQFGEIPVVGDGSAQAGVDTVRGGVVIRPEDFNPERILLDDTFLSTPVVNVGDGFTTNVVGVMDYSFGNFKLNITRALTRVDNGLAREITRAPLDHEIVVGTYNVENLDPSDGSFARHAALVVNNLRSPDLLAIEEIQDNNGAVNDSVTDASATWNALIAAILAAGGPAYDYRQIDPVDDQDGGQPGGNIRVGFLFRTDRGLEFIDRPGGDSTTPVSVVDLPSGPQLSMSPGRIDPNNSAFADSRKPLAGEFRANGKKLFVIANHFSSKNGDQPLFGRFQPPVRSTEAQRHEQAAVVNNFVDQILAADRNANVIVLGDINDFEFSQTVSILEGGVLTSLMDTLPQRERYSYVFEGNSQVLDQILVSGNLLSHFSVDYDPVHVNSEFADQASDHDPQVARFDLRGRPTPKR